MVIGTGPENLAVVLRHLAVSVGALVFVGLIETGQVGLAGMEILEGLDAGAISAFEGAADWASIEIGASLSLSGLHASL